MQIGETQIEVADYNIKSSADGSTELSVTIKEMLLRLSYQPV